MNVVNVKGLVSRSPHRQKRMNRNCQLLGADPGSLPASPVGASAAGPALSLRTVGGQGPRSSGSQRRDTRVVLSGGSGQASKQHPLGRATYSSRPSRLGQRFLGGEREREVSVHEAIAWKEETWPAGEGRWVEWAWGQCGFPTISGEPLKNVKQGRAAPFSSLPEALAGPETGGVGWVVSPWPFQVPVPAMDIGCYFNPRRRLPGQLQVEHGVVTLVGAGGCPSGDQ